MASAAVWVACSDDEAATSPNAIPGGGAAGASAGSGPVATGGIYLDAGDPGGAAGSSTGPHPCAGPNPPAGCELIDLASACGDGSLDEAACTGDQTSGAGCEEECDDGNGLPGDGCSGRCAVEPFYACPTPGSPCELQVDCGDGQRGPGELCDDANTADGDGCSADCTAVEEGFVCPDPGVACTRLVRCGDGVVTPPEHCDDANDANGDGCSDRCRYELGFVCTGNPSVCSPTVCGDGQTLGGESCDDGNTMPYDGCGINCLAEPDCSGGGACTSPCGDGQVIAEQCDDGNIQNGDGCSASCEIETGWVCDNSGTLGDEMPVPVVFRDFREDGPNAHPNFQDRTPDTGFAGSLTGLVETQLDSDGKPVYTGVTYPPPDPDYLTNQADFSTWYRDDSTNLAYADLVPLQRAGTIYYSPAEWAKFFFPLEGRGWSVDPTSPEGTYPVWDFTRAAFAVAPDPVTAHFFFTSEIRYYFRYDNAAAATLSFSGDDDVWVFVAGELVLDLGGIHAPVQGGFTLGPATTNVDGQALNLVPGSVYEIVVFQAERNAGGSTYSLGLNGFDNAPSYCEAVCGDGSVSSGEECDDGTNDGGYNECAPGCVIGEYCGDGIVQDAHEECDNGVNDGGYGECGPGCIIGAYCGDNIVQSPEECDDGANDGGYGECSAGCVLGPYCGDGVVQYAVGEECDDANDVDLDGCSSTCLTEFRVE